MSAQLDILEAEFNAEEAFKKIDETCHNVRRGIFARFQVHKNELGAMVIELHNKIEEMRKEIDQLKRS